MPPARRQFAAIGAVALATLMGIHALRGFLAMIAWNIGVERPALVLGGIAFAVYAAGLAGWIAAPRFDGPRSGFKRVVAFAVFYALSHYVRFPLLTPGSALIAAVSWLWFLPALIGRLSRAGLTGTLAPGCLLGFAAQIAMQTAVHGLDLAMLRGMLPGLGATGLAAALLGTWRPLTADRRPGEASGPRLPGWGLIAFGPYLALQLLLLTNVGRAEMFTGTRLPLASLPALLGLAAGAALAGTAAPVLRPAAAVAGVVLLLRPAWLDRLGIALLLIAQIALAITLAHALRAASTRRSISTYLSGTAGLLLAFAAIFLYYSRYEWPALWPVLAALVAAPALLRRVASPPQGSMGAAAAVVIVGVVGVALGAIPFRSSAQTAAEPTADLRVLDYNVHMGFDAEGIPDPLATARAIEAADADVVALQEVGRGWTVNGGADLFAWLRWRFPHYRAVYGPMNGALWGNAILSRVPISDQGSLRFPLRESTFQRGLTWVTIPTPRGDLLVIATHFANEAEAEGDRLDQAGDVLTFWGRRPRTVVMGDFNADAGSPPISRFQAAGFQDALAPHGLGAAGTFPSPRPAIRIDYVFVTADIASVSGAIPQSVASDHLPIVAVLRLR
jgi:endonuclease/exonuclease/phosphatase family metal-dependent hydrolase